jgi:hypothetical protein
MLGFLPVELSSPDHQRSAAYGRPERQRWITIPARQQIDRDGRSRLSAERKPIWSEVIELQAKATRDRLQDQVLQLIRTEHPEGFVSGEQ